MMSIVTALTAIIISFATTLGGVVDRIGVKGPLEFKKENFNLVHAEKVKDNYYIQEYLPEGEQLEHFNQMLTIHLFVTDIEVADAVGQKIKWLTIRKQTDSICYHNVYESPDGKEVIVDFLLGEAKGDKMLIAEFNVYRYKQIELGKNKKGIIVYAYTKRSYTDDIIPFLTSLVDDKTAYLNAMIGSSIPSVSVDNE